MKILLVATDLSQGGGVNRVIVTLANIMVGILGYDVTVLNGRSTKQPFYKVAKNVTVKQSSSGSAGLLAYVCELLKCRRENYDIVISFWTQDNILATLCFLKSNARIVVCEHTSYFDVLKYIAALRRLVYPLANCVIVLNNKELQHYNYFRRVRMILNAIKFDVETGAATAARDKIVLGVGHLINRKGFSDLIEAFAKSGISTIGWKLVIIGSGPLEDSLKKKISVARCSDSISIVPPTHAINEWYRRCSVIAVPSSVEVFSMVLAEAMSHGVIPVAYRADGPAELLVDFPDQLVNIGDVDALGRRLRTAVVDQHGDAGLRVELRRSIVKRCSPETVADQWLNVFEELGS
jgi:glycosyltransferase involved in cell wall biosynthesis